MKKDELLSKCSSLLANRFSDDPIIRYQLKGTSESSSLLYWFFRSQLEAYDELGVVDYLEDAKGCFAYYNTDELSEKTVQEVLLRKSSLLTSRLSSADKAILVERTQGVLQVCRPKWYRRYWSGAVCSTEFVAIDSSLKGSGAFRRLFISVVENYASKGIPIVGQTTNPDNVPLYQHCGFSVIETLQSPKIPFSCYCVAVLPRSNQEINTAHCGI